MKNKLEDRVGEYGNLVITVNCKKGDFSVLMANCLPDLHFNGDSQCFPLFLYDINQELDKE